MVVCDWPFVPLVGICGMFCTPKSHWCSLFLSFGPWDFKMKTRAAGDNPSGWSAESTKGSTGSEKA